MKKLLCILLLFSFFSLKAQLILYPSMKKAPFTFQWVEKEKIAMLDAEVTVEQYIYYLSELKNDSAEEKYVNAIPLSLYPYYGVEEKKYEMDRTRFDADNKFTDKKSINNPYNKPITNITYEQAVNYSIWYTFKGNENFHVKKDYAKKIMKFRLPTAQEYEKIAMDGIKKGAAIQKKLDVTKYTTEVIDCINDKGCALCNHAGMGNCESNLKMMAQFGKGLYPVAMFFSNGYGLYDLQGNAAEMVLEKNKALGGSYKDKVENCKPGSVQSYDGPQPWLGFRLIGEVVDVDGKDVVFEDDMLYIKGINR
ncbi:MAG: SUMF1/EgtB/PvdO family nonheme iron enzyme [Cytophagaceae bacterium]